MRLSAIKNISETNKIAASRKSNVTLRLEAIRAGLRKYGAVIVDLQNEIDIEAIRRLRKVHGKDNVKVEQSSNARLTITNFKR